VGSPPAASYGRWLRRQVEGGPPFLVKLFWHAYCCMMTLARSVSLTRLLRSSALSPHQKSVMFWCSGAEPCRIWAWPALLIDLALASIGAVLIIALVPFCARLYAALEISGWCGFWQLPSNSRESSDASLSGDDRRQSVRGTPKLRPLSILLHQAQADELIAAFISDAARIMEFQRRIAFEVAKISLEFCSPYTFTRLSCRLSCRFTLA
jgi:hypothetical protein